jgi:hypothetical protein
MSIWYCGGLSLERDGIEVLRGGHLYGNTGNRRPRAAASAEPGFSNDADGWLGGLTTGMMARR